MNLGSCQRTIRRTRPSAEFILSVQDAVRGRALAAMLRRRGVVVGGGLCLRGAPIVDISPGSTLRIGNRVVLCSRSLSTALGVNHRVVIRTLREHAELVIGDDLGMSGGSICAATSVVIGKGCLLGANVLISDTDFHPIVALTRRYASLPPSSIDDGVRIGDNVFIGANATILKGVCIGSNSVIGAGSVVTRSVPSGVIAAGNPCRVIRKIAGDLESAPVGERQ